MPERQRIAIVTGGSRGIGRSAVLGLAARGVRSIFTYKTSEDAAREVVEESAKAGATGVMLQLDTGEVDSFDAFVGEVRTSLAELGADRFDYLVNNAGISNHTPFAEVAPQELDHLYEVNFKGPFFLTQKLLPLIRDGGQIVNISSGLTRFANPNSMAYATLKGALEVMTLYLAQELGTRGITANTVAPGAVQTDFSGGTVRDDPAVNAAVAKMTALGRPGLPEDIGEMLAAMLSDATHWVNAQRIEVSGGMRL